MSDDDDWNPDAGGEADVHDSKPNEVAGVDDNEGSGPTVKDEDGSDDDDYDDMSQLKSFYEEASNSKMDIPHSSSQNHSQQDVLSQHSANLSLAEMSRMEESLLSQTSHHEEEEERQRKKLEKRTRRNKGIKVKKTRRPPTEIQIKRRKEYQRFKHKKGTDLSQEPDVGGSVEYLVRKKLDQQAEQRRMRAVARERMQKKRRMDIIEEASLLDDVENGKDDSTSANDGIKLENDSGPNWNFLDEGFVTMPRADADKLPYYVYRNSKRKSSSVLESDISSKASGDVNGDSRGGQLKKRRKTGHLMFLEQSTTASGTSNRRKNKSTRNINTQLTLSTDEPDNGTRSFPLHFNQLKTRMDLHGMVDTATLGSERMVVAHGRNAKRLWTRMVAGGIMNDDHDGSHNMDKEDNGIEAKNDDDSISNVSSSSSSKSSSACSYQPTGVYSQMSYGTTSVIGMENVDDMNENSVIKAKQNPLFRLMSMVHTLPKITYRQQFLMKVAQELGTNRRLWEDELRSWVEGTDSTGVDAVGNSTSVEDRKSVINLTPRERWAIKSFLGVDGSVSSPPLWASDPSIPTHPTVLKQRMHSLRSSLRKRFRRWIEADQKKRALSSSIEDIAKTLKAGTDAELESSFKSEEVSSNVKTQEGEEDMHYRAFNDGVNETTKTEDSIHGEMKIEDSINVNHEPTKSLKKELPSIEEGEEGVPDEMMNLSSTTIADESAITLGSLMDGIQNDTDPGGIDKYAKILHESNIDTSNIDVALASFVDQLTASQARLRQKQQLDSSHFQHRHALSVAQDDVAHWHESIVSYLELACTLTTARDASFYKSGNEFPECAPLAQAVMATQSYFANGGFMGCGRKRKNSQPSSWEVKNENHSSDDSEASDQHNDELKTMMFNAKSPLNKLEKKELRGIQLAAKDIAKRGKDRLADNHLTSFTPIHLTTGIAMIAANLTPQAAELVSRPCCPDASDNRTPFDLISNMLTLIEEDGSLTSPPRSNWDSKGKIIDEVLAKSMLDAAMVFRKCIETDPRNVDHWSWYVATLLGMLCITFGSSMTSRIQTNVKSEHEQTERPQLESFHEIRNNSSVALTDFVKFTQSHDCPMFHLAISSMLEWKKAIVLLHRPRSFSISSNEFSLEVTRLHAYHTNHWANKVCSRTSITKVQKLCDESNLLPRDALLDILARAIERDPCDRKNWARLVNALGALDIKESDAQCLHAISLQSLEGCRWRGKHRVTEWEDQFFRAPKSTDKVVKPEFVRIVSDIVDSALFSNVRHVQNVQRMAANSCGGEAITSHDPKDCMSWIWNPLEDTREVDYDRGAFVDDALLPMNNSTMALNSHSELLFNSEIQEQLSRNPSCEALCMKIVVACHLMGNWHPFVCNSIWWLAVKLWQSTQTTDKLMPADRNTYCDGLTWLSMHGLDISVYLQCRLKSEEF
eukprot:CAMPEP_0172330690 /NCGR_PEP_ID=MMETSP1058-20130122/61511_1 /TAXON_ID=83371 /ORGANISM="Detonula confervacea, Strain CCMP 353" /LENGTH=1428 /DNA_ID=CAMNT_0013047915 /DNA_START=70 /DNA_END=4356 /DNA_ORIENTATION=+